MRDWICGFFMAWGMFLAIPCPRKIWSEGARQKMLVCMPLVGLLAGGVWAGAWLLLRGAPGPVRAAVCAAVFRERGLLDWQETEHTITLHLHRGCRVSLEHSPLMAALAYHDSEKGGGAQ